jgi:hypothetical protein
MTSCGRLDLQRAISQKDINERTILQALLALIERVSVRNHAVQHLTKSIPTMTRRIRILSHMH